jgi:5-methylcytosine-specific restriction endonuclease McrA
MARRGGQPPWAGSQRKDRLPANWYSQIRPKVFARFGRTCHWCGRPGADDVDHLVPGDDHGIDNLRPIHSWRTPQRCHAYKSAAEGVAARRRDRPPEQHPALR